MVEIWPAVKSWVAVLVEGLVSWCCVFSDWTHCRWDLCRCSVPRWLCVSCWDCWSLFPDLGFLWAYGLHTVAFLCPRPSCHSATGETKGGRSMAFPSLASSFPTQTSIIMPVGDSMGGTSLTPHSADCKNAGYYVSDFILILHINSFWYA